MKIEVQDLVKSYGRRRVVDGVSLEVSQGEVVGLLGSNGAGKTTTFSMVVGLVKPDGGSILLGGKNMARYPMHKRARLGVSYLAQEASVFRPLSVEDNLKLVWQLNGISRKEQKERLARLLDEFALERVRKSKGCELSGGERRRVEIARSLALEPKFLLLDEPFTGVDPIAVAEIQDIIGRLRERGIGVLITDHNVRETLAITDRAYIIREGQILVAGDPKTIAASQLARKYYLGEKFQTGFESVSEPVPEPVS
ncbi:MAG: LPS export ABC transporter ATP-binding protein [Candidatus Eremiobacteraeota bacterium]|nr:LPS export ABC transporter ATP-binding protein [Candidatus Eremiobacteraeota bacterium]